ncbi:MAG: hypothetical protein ACK52I_29280 [Pseudomonadota bacterium]
MSKPLSRSAFAKRALAHAKASWCWDDESAILEHIEWRWSSLEKNPDKREDPEGFIDFLADKYSLIDPSDWR